MTNPTSCNLCDTGKYQNASGATSCISIATGDATSASFAAIGADPSIITFEDLLACKVGHTVISMLIDVEGFSVYDRREQNLHDGDDDEEN